MNDQLSIDVVAPEYRDFMAQALRDKRRANDRGEMMPKSLDARIAALRDNPHKGLRLRNAKDSKTAEIYLYDVIGDGFFFGVSPADVVRQLQDLDDDVEEIQLHINSPGGSAFDGIAILNALRDHDARVVCTVDGLAASAASFIAVGSDEVIMARNSELMIHDAWGLCVGNAADMHELGDTLDKLSDNIASIYAEDGSSDATAEEWRDVMRAETWYTAEEAVEAGLADKVAPKKKSTGKSGGNTDDDGDAKDRFDLSIFTYAGRQKAPAPHMPPAASASGSKKSHERSSDVKFTDEQLVNLRNRLGLAEDADEAAIMAALDEAPDDEPDESGSESEETEEEESEEDETSENNTEVPEGMALIDSEVLAQLQSSAQAGQEARTQQLQERRDREIEAAIRAGKTTPGRRNYWQKSWKADPEGTSKMLAELAPGMVPVEPVGHDGEGGGENTSADIRESAEYKNWSLA